MNYLRITRRKLKNFIIETLVITNLFSLILWMCLVDSIISWQPLVIMIVNISFLWLAAYVNGYIYDTERYYERLAKEGEFYE